MNSHLSRLLNAGKKIFVTRRGKRVAQLSAAKEPKKAKFGCAKSPNFYMAPDFDAPLEDFQEYMGKSTSDPNFKSVDKTTS